MRPLFLSIALSLLLLSNHAAAEAGDRIALVIGNATYSAAPELDNAVDDAKAIAAVFKRLGFRVFEGYNLRGEQMRTTLSQFADALQGSSAAIMYYSGHGMSLDGDNFLLPTDISPKTPSDVDLNAISAAQVLRQMRREERTAILILDACREDPFATVLSRTKTRAVIGERGLKAIEGELARGALIAFATDPNNVAFDGPPGQHSPFTKALLNHLEDSSVSIETVMSRVRSEVWETTNRRQLPWVNTSLIGEFDLNPRETPSATIAKAPAPESTPQSTPLEKSMETILWESAQRSNLPADYKSYLDAFPNGFFAAMARNRIAALSHDTADRPVHGSAPKKNTQSNLETPTQTQSVERPRPREHKSILSSSPQRSGHARREAPHVRNTPSISEPDPSPPVTGSPHFVGASGGGGGGGGGWSDRRLKRDIRRIGTSPSGLAVYSFRYIWGGPTYVGVIAQELLRVRPDAVIKTDSGYLSVDYAKIDVQMTTLATWRSTARLNRQAYQKATFGNDI